jgi:shikimate kinase
MPSAGKTKAGRWLAKILGWKFVDIDDEIKAYEGVDTLGELVNSLPPEQFAALENYIAIRTVLNLTEPTIVATGGSVIYLSHAMKVLREKTLIIYLHASRRRIVRRLKRTADQRGVVIRKGQSFGDLYDERTPLLKKSADLRVRVGNNREIVAHKLSKKIRRALAA